MGMPALLTANATGTTGLVWMPDWLQTPFQVGIAATLSGGGQYAVEYSPTDLNYPGTGTTLANATWIAITGFSAATTSPLGRTSKFLVGPSESMSLQQPPRRW